MLLLSLLSRHIAQCMQLERLGNQYSRVMVSAGPVMAHPGGLQDMIRVAS